MREHRSPNPLTDSRRPRNGAEADLNPPGFVWRPVPDATHYEVQIGKTAGLTARTSQSHEIRGRTLFLLSEPLKPGTYHWRWRALGCGQDKKWSETFAFVVTSDTPHLTVPSGREVIARIAPGHPRHMLPAARLDDFRSRCQGTLNKEWEQFRTQAEERLRENFRMTEPPFLPSRATHHDTWGRLWRDAMNHSRIMATDAQNFGLVYLIGGEERFGRAAAERLLEFAKWDPDGSTSIPHNDEPHMSIINWAQRAYDWAFGAMSDGERSTIREAFRQRGMRTHQLLVRQDVQNHQLRAKLPCEIRRGAQADGREWRQVRRGQDAFDRQHGYLLLRFTTIPSRSARRESKGYTNVASWPQAARRSERAGELPRQTAFPRPRRRRRARWCRLPASAWLGRFCLERDAMPQPRPERCPKLRKAAGTEDTGVRVEDPKEREGGPDSPRQARRPTRPGAR